jgi:uncharacterized membrane protein SpoIIM required for sporulation
VISLVTRQRWLVWPALAVSVFAWGTAIGAASAVLLPGYPIRAGAAPGSVLDVFEHNLVVLLFITAGAVTLGLTAAVELLLNGGIFGFVGAELVLRNQAGMLWSAVAPQFVFEVGAYVLAAAASLRMGWQFWWPFVTRSRQPRLPWKRWLVAESVAVAMLYAGAFVEVNYAHI